VTILYFAALSFLALLLQTAALPLFLPAWLLEGFDLPLLLTVHLAISRRRGAAMLGGAALGYLQDALSGSGVLGVNGAALALAGYVGGFLKERFYVATFAQRLGAVTGAVASAVAWRILVRAVFGLAAPSPFSLTPLLTFAISTMGALWGTRILDRLETRLKIRSEGLMRLEG
jgi:rod shape-determining protein MreD